MEQRSDEWFEARCGSLGASKIGVAIARLKRSGDRTAAALDYMYELAAERITNVPAKRSNPNIQANLGAMRQRKTPSSAL